MATHDRDGNETNDDEGRVSPELTGGAGFTFEDAVAAVYAVALLAENSGPGIKAIVSRIAFQQGAFDQPLDDLIIEGMLPDGAPMRLSLQVKRALTISGRESNSDFRDTIVRAYRTIASAGFRKGSDRVGVVVGEIANASKRVFDALCELARSKAERDQFFAQVDTPGVAGRKYRDTLGAIRKILSAEVDAECLDDAAFLLFSHFELLQFDLLHEGALTEAEAVARLRDQLEDSDRLRADDLWKNLLATIRAAQGRAAVFDRKLLVSRLGSSIRLTGAPSNRSSLRRLREDARLAALEIANEINGLHVARPGLEEAVRRSAKSHRLVQIAGLPGAGKSVILRALVSEAVDFGPVLFLKADRLVGSGWTQYATSLGLQSNDLESLLVDIAATGTSCLFIDGLDRIEVSQRSVVLDVVNTIVRSKLLREWRLIATVRDTGMEPLRTWLPRLLLDSPGATIVEVKAFSDEEAEIVAAHCPSLREVLFSKGPVQEIARKPFFASVLCRTHSESQAVPATEIDLATQWWARGGFDANPMRVSRRRNALIRIAQAGASSLGRRVPILELDAEAITELEHDGVLQSLRVGHTVRFSHDIFFEWAFLQLLVSKGDDWIALLQEIGEPPVLGRTVELLAQSELVHADWARQLARLERETKLRPQWLRAWLLGPVGLPTFATLGESYTEAVLEPGAERISKLAVWFQAEKTRANPVVLDSELTPEIAPARRLRLADMLAWPSDINSWRRCCHWMLDNLGRVPFNVTPDILSVLEVWQNAFSDSPSILSNRIHAQCLAWLQDIEDRMHGRRFSSDMGPWGALRYGELEELEQRLRALVLRAARAFPERVGLYFDRLASRERLWLEAATQIYGFSPALSDALPHRLVDLVSKHMRRDLPNVVAKRVRERGGIGYGMIHHDWNSLAIRDEGKFFPASPLREPFHSLFASSPVEARRLVRELANHAITAWRQLHSIDYERRAKPIPLSLVFPWGTQDFWGDRQVYLWPRGAWGPHAVESGLMALEEWALLEVGRGREASEVIQEVLEGHESTAALGVAAAVALETQCRSEVTLPLAASQRLWSWDIARAATLTSNANLIGFQPSDHVHRQAVAKSNARASRGLDLRNLAMLFVLGEGELAVRAQAAIQDFPNDLPIEFEEDRQDEGLLKALHRTAEIWAEFGRPSNYAARRTEDGSGILIAIDNPAAKGPDVDAAQTRHTQLVENLSLLNWVERCFDKGSLDDSHTLASSMDRARAMSGRDTFSGYQRIGDLISERRSAVVGVASVAICFGGELTADEMQWARLTCMQALSIEEDPSDPIFRSSVLVHHPVLYATRAVAALLVRTSDVEFLKTLIVLSGHRLEAIALEALRGLLSMWGTLPAIGWLGLSLGLQLSLVARPSPDSGRDRQADLRVAAIEKAKYMAGVLEQSPAPLPSPPPPWEFIEGSSALGHDPRGHWRTPDVDLDWSFLPKVLKFVPVREALADGARRDYLLAWLDEMTAWLIARLHPEWAEDDRHDRGRGAELAELRRALYRFCASISMEMDPGESIRRFVAPLDALDDEVAASLIEPFSDVLVCRIMDDSVFPNGALEVLRACSSRILKHREWKRARRDFGRVHDMDLYFLVRSIFLVAIERAEGAARFANGDWTEIEKMFPILDAFLEQAGESIEVIDAFLTLVERAFASYPDHHFVAQVSGVVYRQSGHPVGWAGTTIPHRVASLIQQFAERTQPIPLHLSREMLRLLDSLVDMGDRRAAAIQTSEVFKDVRVTASV